MFLGASGSQLIRPAGKPWQSSSRHGRRSDRQVLAVLGIQCRTVSHRHASDEGWNYHYVPIRFYEQVEEQLAQNPKITLLKSTRVSEVKPVEDCLELVLESGSDVTESASRVVTAGQIVDTRIPRQVDVGSAMLKQVFFGLEVRLESPHRLDDVARVMKDMRVDNEGFMFDYVLPLDRHTLLVEFTRFAAKSLPAESLRPDALESLRRVCGDASFQIVREECGVIPMGLSGFAVPTDPRWIYTGLGAGARAPQQGMLSNGFSDGQRSALRAS